MDQDGIPGPLLFNLKRESPFSFKCQVCGACCHNKAIQVAPYEALRLSRNLGLSTTDFYRNSTEEGGTVLRARPDGRCLFLGPAGCSIHPDRPLVCRLFPLGLIKDNEGRTRYGVMPLHPDCLGHFDTDGTVESYLGSQQLKPYFHYDAAYDAVFRKMLKQLKEMGPEAEEVPLMVEAPPPEAGSSLRHELLSAWLDIDKTVAAFRKKHGRRKPETLDGTVALHLEAIDDRLAGLNTHRRQVRRRRGIALP